LKIPHITFRSAAIGDGEWLFALKRATMRDSIAAVYGWDDEVQRRMFEEKFEPGKIRIIQVDGRDGGLLDVRERDDHVFLGRIEVMPVFQRQGIGAAVIQSVVAEAKKKHLPVLLQVLKPNPARALYERLGFFVYEETATHFKMKKESTNP